MPREGAIKIEGVVVEAINDRLYRVELANGHRLLGHLPRRRSREKSPSPLNGERAGVRGEIDKNHPLSRLLNAGDKVVVEMSPFDFSKGRILLED